MIQDQSVAPCSGVMTMHAPLQPARIGTAPQTDLPTAAPASGFPDSKKVSSATWIRNYRPRRPHISPECFPLFLQRHLPKKRRDARHLSVSRLIL